MEVTTTAKIQIIVPEEYRKALYDTMEAYRSACNHVSRHIFQTHDLSKNSLHKKLYYQIRELFNLKSQMAESVLKTVIARYRTILENEKKWIQPEFRKRQLDYVWRRDYSLCKNAFSINTLQKRIRVGYISKAMEKYFVPGEFKFGTAKLVLSRKGKFYLHIPMTKDYPTHYFVNTSNVVGIDQGINFAATTYDRARKTLFFNGRSIKQKRTHFKELRKELQRCQTPSARRRLKAVGQRENRWMQDTSHCITKALVESNPRHTIFVLEDLTGIRKVTELVRRKDRYVRVSWPFNDFEQKLRYKAACNGSLVLKVPPHHTSQRCPKCGHVSRKNRDRKKHLFRCRECGYTSNDDRIAAMNLYQTGKEILIQLQRSMSPLQGARSMVPWVGVPPIPDVTPAALFQNLKQVSVTKVGDYLPLKGARAFQAPPYGDEISRFTTGQ